MQRPITLALIALALAAAGCGGSSSSSSKSSGGSSSGGSSSSGSSSGGSPSSGAATVKMQNIAFSPKSLTVKVGQKVTWTNEDSVQHNVTATSGATFKSANFSQGGTFTYVPKKAGTIKYVCTLHPGMSAELKVTG